MPPDADSPVESVAYFDNQSVGAVARAAGYTVTAVRVGPRTCAYEVRGADPATLLRIARSYHGDRPLVGNQAFERAKAELRRETDALIHTKFVP